MSALEHYQITDAVIGSRSSHISHTHEHHNIRWKPNVGENHLLQCVSSFFQIRNSFYTDFVLVQSFTSTQAATCRELQLSLIFQSLLEGSYNPLLLFNKYTTVTVHYSFSDQ